MLAAMSSSNRSSSGKQSPALRASLCLRRTTSQIKSALTAERMIIDALAAPSEEEQKQAQDCTGCGNGSRSSHRNILPQSQHAVLGKTLGRCGVFLLGGL